MRLNIRKISILVALILSTSSFAETSIFSNLGIGDLKPNVYLPQGMATTDSTTLSSLNYATWSDIKNTTFSVSASYDYNEVNQKKNQQDFSTNYDNLTISGFNFAVPFGDKTNRNILGFSFFPYSRVDLENISGKETINNPFETINVETLEKKSGGLNKLSLLYAKRYSDFSFSLDLSSLFGSFKTVKSFRYSNESTDNNSFDEKLFWEVDKAKILNFTVGAGFRYTYDKISFGGAFSIPFSQSTELEKTDLYNPRYESSTKSTTDVDDTEWPLELSFGASYDFGKLKLASDISYINFEDKKLGLSENEEYSNYLKTSLSASYRHSSKKIAPYYQKIGINTAIAFEERAVEYNNNKIDDISASLGFDFPYDYDRASIETIFTIIQSGDKDKTEFESTTYKFGLIFNGSASWWLRDKKYDD